MECIVANHLQDSYLKNIVINLRNIDRKKQDEYLLKKSEEKYQNLFNNSPIPMWIYDVNTLMFIDVNDAAIRHYQYSREEFLKMSLKDIRPANEHDKLLKAVEIAKNVNYNDNPNRYTHIKKNGEKIIVRIESSSLSPEDKSKRIVLAFDITNMVKHEDELTTTNSKLKYIQATAQLGFWHLDMLNKTVQWTDEVDQIFETSADTNIYKPEDARNFVYPEDIEAVSTLVKQCIDTRTEGHLEYRIRTQQGHVKWVYSKFVVVFSNNQPIAIEGTLYDITDRKQKEQNLKHKSALLEALNTFTHYILAENQSWEQSLSLSANSILESLNADRLTYFKLNTEKDNTSLNLAWLHHKEAHPLLDNNIEYTLQTLGPDLYHLLLNGETVETHTQQAPNEKLKATLNTLNVKSIMILPLIVNGSLHGVMCLHNCTSEQLWDVDDKNFLKALTSTIAVELEKNLAKTDAGKTKILLESLVNNLPGISIRRQIGGDWPTLFISKEIERLTGYTVEDFINKPATEFYRILHPDDKEIVFSKIQHLSPNEQFTVKFRIVCKDGGIKWFRGNGICIADPYSNYNYIDAVLLDITNHHNNEELLKVSNERFGLVMKALHEALIDWDIINDKVVWGAGFSELFGYTSISSNEKLWAENIHPDDRERVLYELKTALKDNTVDRFNTQFKFLKANRSVAYVQFRSYFIRNESGYAIRAVGALIDQTETMARVKKIEQQNETFKEIAWLQSHVVRAPLASIIGLLNLLKNNETVLQQEGEIINYMEESANKMDEIVHRMVKKAEEVTDITR